MIDKEISHYKILEKLGGGGMGIVYKARDLRLDRHVALKFLPPELTRDPYAKKRFVQEAKAASALEHPNICTVFEIDETEDEQCFIAMSYCEGETLRKKLDRHVLDINEAIDIGIQIALGLAKAHEKKIIHRDIKPANIAITADGMVKILDFGLAKLSAGTKLTRETATFGTVSYMSPEQARGEQVDHRTDIWSLGVVLFEMLTGKLPFISDYDQAIIYSILNERQPRMHNIRPEIPVELESIVERALAKTPDQRYQRVDEIVKDLRRLTANLPQKAAFHRPAQTPPEEERKLAAIMFTDMVGYSALTQKNERLALELLEEHRRILRSFFPMHSGREVETIGDAFFVEFTSALEAVRCAIDIQKALYDRNNTVAEDNQIRIRIGVHLGDVIHSGNNVLGDGVNIAARIEPCAHSSGICVSQDVARQIHNKIDHPLKKIRKSQLKNIQLPVEIYAVVLPWQKKDSAFAFFPNAKKIRRFIVAIVLPVIFLIIAIFTWRIFSNDATEKNSIAVLPFKNLSGKIENEYFSDGITEDIIACLSKIKNLKVISRTSVMQYKNSEKNLRDIGQELDVATIMEGSVRCDNNRVRIVAQLIDAQEDEHLWTETYDEFMTEIFDIQSAVAEKIAVSLRANITPVKNDFFNVKATENMEAYDLYLKGRYHLNKRMPDDLKKGIDFFTQALASDPNYAHAYSGLADSYMILGNYNLEPPLTAFTKAKEAAGKALEINDGLAEAYSSLAFVQMHGDWNWAAAEKGFKKAIDLDPGYATAYSLYASYLTALGRSDEAQNMRQHARELDPLSTYILLDEALELYFEEKYDRTIEHCRKLIQTDPFLILAYIPLCGAYIQKSMYDDAIGILTRASWFSGGNQAVVAAMGYTYAASGKTGDAQMMAELLIEKSQEEYVSPFWIAVVYTGLNNKDEAFSWLEKAARQRDGSMVFLNVTPIFKPLRSDPRFQKLLLQIGLI